jgi:uncharacterized protein YecE (DUF72 family)
MRIVISIDEQGSLFPDDAPAPARAAPSLLFSRDAIATVAAQLPPSLYLGTSTWTYPGWTGLVYERPYPKTGATVRMLEEYARYPLFRTVGIDSFFYRPPTPELLQQYASVLPPDFPCVMKVWDRVTSHSLRSPRNPQQSDGPNPDWLNPKLFEREVLEPTLRHFGDHAGPFVFEIEAVPDAARMSTAAFAHYIDIFFSQLPRGPMYAVEIRNAEFLEPVYFDTLRKHNVAHLFNSWTRMPAIGVQLVLDSFTADFVVSRALLKPGRKYAEAVDRFAPYTHIMEEAPEVRADLAALVRKGMTYQKAIFIIANNRLEGSSPLTLLGLAYLLIDGKT